MAEQVTVVAPSANVSPEPWSQATGPQPSTASLAEVREVDARPRGRGCLGCHVARQDQRGCSRVATVTSKVPRSDSRRCRSAEQVTVVAPSAKTSPEAWSQETGTSPSTPSLAEAEKSTLAPPGPVATAVRSPGRTRAGAVVSLTVTSKLPDVRFLAASTAEQVTVVVPTAKVSPEAWSHVTGTSPSTASLAEVVKSTLAPPGPVASAVRSPGRTRAGAVVSAIETVNEPLADRSPVSVTVQVTVVVPSGKTEPDAREQTGVGSGLSSASVALAVYGRPCPAGAGRLGRDRSREG